jgi:hypothetical protein
MSFYVPGNSLSLEKYLPHIAARECMHINYEAKKFREGFLSKKKGARMIFDERTRQLLSNFMSPLSFQFNFGRFLLFLEATPSSF